MDSSEESRFQKHICTNDRQLDKEYRRGDTGKKVALFKEWLYLQGIHVAVEGNSSHVDQSESYEVCERIRNYELKDFILI